MVGTHLRAGLAETMRFTGAYVRRVVDDELDDLFPSLPAVLLDGPKGVGKTATALQRSRTVRRLDMPDERGVVEADPMVVALDAPPVLVDEWQRVPEVFDAVRRLVDADPTGGRFLLTGSAPTTATHSGAGRITTIRMRPLTLPERLELAPTVSMHALLRGEAEVHGRCELTLADYVGEITASGLPGLRDLTPRARERQLDSYVDRIIDHDLPELGHAVRRPEIVRSWLRAYAAATASTASYEAIRNAATSGVADKPARTTTSPYIALLERLRILDPLEAWLPTASHFSTLSSGPKHYLADPALATRLLRMSATRLIAGAAPDIVIPRDGSFLGAAFEALVGLSVRTFAQRSDARAYHLRTHAGRHAVDFIVETADGVLAIEAKLSGNVDSKDVQHLLWLRSQRAVDCIDTVVVNTGREAYRRKDGVAVVPLALLGP